MVLNETRFEIEPYSHRGKVESSGNENDRNPVAIGGVGRRACVYYHSGPSKSTGIQI